jgi:hypothetical protein
VILILQNTLNVFVELFPVAHSYVLFGCSDILLGLMKRLIKERASDLKVLITSATLDGLKVSRFFSGCPVLNIPGTLFPVEKFFSAERPTNYIESSIKTAIGKGHPCYVNFCSSNIPSVDINMV